MLNRPHRLSSGKAGSTLLITLGILSLLAVLGGVYYLNSPDYVAKKNLRHADEQLQQGHYGQAAELYFKVVASGTTFSPRGQEALKNLSKPEVINRATPGDAAKLIVTIKEAQDRFPPTVYIPDLFNVGISLIGKHKEADPRDAKIIFQAIESLRKPSKRLSTLRLELHERVAKKHPDDVENAVDLAVIYASMQRFQAIEPLLSPLEEQLEDTEGARLLGQIYARQGKIDAAYRLLNPYTTKRLAAYLEAEKAYNDRLNKVYDRAIQNLNNNLAPQKFYDDYDKADEKDQNMMVQEYIRKQLDEDAMYKELLTSYEETTNIVPVALDFGIILLRKAQTETDREKRNAQLENAENTFLAINGAVGDTDEYKLYLGQVYYWLGRFDEGEKQFNALLASNKRSHSIMMAVGQILREVGETTKARAIAEEAYRNTRVTTEKYQAAQFRALMYIDTDDEIKWLSNSDPSNAHIQASLNAAKGTRAESKYQYNEAKQYYHKAVALYMKQPETAPVLNNTALVYLSLYRVTKDREVLQKGLDMFDRAIALNPSQGITIYNAVSYMITAGLSDVIGDKIDLKLLAGTGSFDYLPYLYGDHLSKKKYIKLVSEHESIKKGMSYTERVMLLMPKEPTSYGYAYQTYRFTNDLDKLSSVAEKIMTVEFDLETNIQEKMKYYNKEDDKKYFSRLNRSIDHNSTLLKRIDQKKDPVTYSVVLDKYVDNKMTLARMGQKVDIDNVVSLAQKAYRVSPSVKTRSTLTKALFLRASERFAKNNQAYRGMLNRSQRALTHQELITIALDSNILDSGRVINNRDFKRAIDLAMSSNEKFPKSSDIQDWALFRHIDSSYAAKLKKRLLNDKRRRYDNIFVEKFNAADVSSVYSLAWSSEVDGKTDKAKQWISQAAQKGLPMPLSAQNIN